MRCGAQASGSMVGEARAVRGGGRKASSGGAYSAPVLNLEEEVRWAEWATRPNRPTWRLGRKAGQSGGATGPKIQREAFWNENWILEFTKALEICIRRFWRNFDTRIFPKFF
jgi:hypothetical protein